MPNRNELNLLDLLRNNPHGWGNFPPSAPEVATEDDAGNSYGFDNALLKPWMPEPQQSWGEAALDVGTAPARLATGLASSLSPYGAEDGWQVPPIIAEPVRALNRLSEHGGFPNPSDPQNQQDMSALVMAMFGGNAFAPARAGEAVAARALSDTGKPSVIGSALAGAENQPVRAYHGSDRGFSKFKEPDGGGLYSDLDVPHEGVWFADDPARAEWFANSAHRRNADSPNPGTGPAIYPADLNFKNPYFHPADLYADEGISSLPSEFELRELGHDGAVVPRAEWGGYESGKLQLKHLGTDYQALGTGTVKSPLTGETLFSDTGKPSLMGSALAGAENHLPMDLESRMTRAKEQGYDTSTPLYHGSNGPWYGDGFVASSNGNFGPGVYGSKSPVSASGYAERVGDGELFDGGHVTPFFARGKLAPSGDYNAALEAAALDEGRVQDGLKSRGYSGVSDRQGDVVNVFDPSNIRSVNAAFDPQHAGKTGLLLSDTGKPSALGAALAGAENHALASPIESSQNLGFSDTMSLRNEGGYDPPKIEQRPFMSDYGTRDVGPRGSALKTDIEGRPLNAPFVAGRRTSGGSDEALSPKDIADVADKLSYSVRAVPRSELGPHTLGTYDYRDGSIRVADDLEPSGFSRVLAHELGHSIDDAAYGSANGLDISGFPTKARKVYHDLATGDYDVTRPSKMRGPETYGYKGDESIRAELSAELLRAYMTNPNYLKTVNPKGAKAIRDFVNGNPILNHTIQFNSGGAPAVGAMAGANQNQPTTADLLAILEKHGVKF